LSPFRPFIALCLALSLAPLAVPAPVRAADGDAGAYLAARTAAASSDYVEAARWFTRALIADPSNPQLLEGAIVGQIASGRVDLAVPIAQRLAATGSTSQSARLVVLADQAARGAWDGLLADAGAREGGGPLAESLIAAWAELGAGRMSDALAGFDQVAATRGSEAFGLYHKALALASVGDFEGADTILSGETAGAVAVMRRGVIAYAQILSQLERNADALALLDSQFGTAPDPVADGLRVRLAAGETLPFDIAPDAAAGIAEVFYSVATALSGEASQGSTLVFARLAGFLRPDHTDALLMAAGLLEALDQYALATEAFARVAPDNPSYFMAEIGRARALAASGRTDAAIEALQQLSRVQPELAVVHVSLGDLYRREARFDEAAQAYDRAIAVLGEPLPPQWFVYYSRGISHERMKRFDLADADFRRALELNPDQPQVLNYLGYSLVERRQQLEEALEMIQRAVAAEPESGYIVDSLAWALFTLGRHQEAVMPMERASILEPVDPIVTDHLGDVYWAVGRRLEAEFQWHRALSFDPEPDLADRIRRKLEVGLDAVLAEEGAPPLGETAVGAAADGD
jgi:tetratricopeptide (TPR) repeat protein